MALAVVVAPSFTATAAAAERAERSRAVNVTDTVRGQAFASQAAQRAAAVGARVSATDFAVWEINGRLIAGPPGGMPQIDRVTGPRGFVSERYTAAEPVPSDAAPAAEQEEVAISAAGWQMVGDHCWIEQRRDGEAWIDVCYHKFKATSDGSSTYDYYALNMFATAAIQGCCFYELGDQWIESAPNAGAVQTWHDWSPRSDTSLSNCTTVSLSVKVDRYGLSIPFTQCEQWDITKHAAAGQFRNTWKEGLCMQIRGEREVAFIVASRVAQGTVPYWKFSWFNGRDWAGCSS